MPLNQEFSGALISADTENSALPSEVAERHCRSSIEQQPPGMPSNLISVSIMACLDSSSIWRVSTKFALTYDDACRKGVGRANFAAIERRFTPNSTVLHSDELPSISEKHNA